MKPVHRSSRRLARLLVAGALLLSLAAAGTAAGAAPAAPRTVWPWQDIMTEGFEAGFPTPGWYVYDQNGTTNGEYYWGAVDCMHRSGSHSAWGTGAGADAGGLACGGFPPDNARSWMVYGPFDLSPFADAELEFWLWNFSATSDILYWKASADGMTWVTGGQHSGVTGPGYTPEWEQFTFDLGPWTGDSSVWVAWYFNTDDDKTIEGPYVDDIVLRGLPAQAVFRSAAANDGWVRESTEMSSVGGARNSVGVTCRVGDDALDRQYRSILDFQTRSLPDGAVIIGAVLEIKGAGGTGTNPTLTHGSFTADIRTGAFHSVAALEVQDFQAAPTLRQAARFGPLSTDGWYRAALRAEALPLINTTGRTQVRLRFTVGDDDDEVADYLAFVCGDALAPARRPVLRVAYLLP